MNGKRYLLAFVLLFMGFSTVRAQVNYNFSTSTGTFTSISGTSPALTGGTTDDGWWNNIPLNFTFYYNATNTVTQVHAGTNGYMALGSALTAADLTNNLSGGITGSRPLIAPLWDDLLTPSMTYTTTGPVGSRVFTMQWNNTQWYYSSSTATLNMQVKLYETTNVIELMYSQINAPVNTPSASIGITATGTGSGNFMSLQSITSPSVSTTNEVTTLSTVPANTAIYRFTPNFCTGTVVGGTATLGTSTFNCSGTPSLNLTGATTPILGLQFVWQSSPAGQGTWTNISSALTNPAFTAPSITANTDYRCQVTCTVTGSTATSTTVTATVLTPSAVLSGSQTVCAGTGAGLTVNFTNGTAPYTITYNDGVTPVTVNSIGTSSYTLNVNPSVNTTYTLTAVSDANCSGTASGSATVTVNPQPTASVVAGASPVCEGQTSTLIITGTANATVNYLDNGNPQSVVLDGAGNATVTVTPTSQINVYALTSVVGTFCSQTLSSSATITMDAAPTATISNSGPSTICNGTGASLDITLGGSAGPWSFSYSDGTVTTPVSNYGGNTYTVNDMPGTTTTYSVVTLVDDVTGCAALSGGTGTPETITVNPSPNVTITNSGVSSVCSGDAASLEMTFGGTAGPWSFTYSDGSNSTPVANNALNPYPLTLNPSVTTTYNVVSLTDDVTGCAAQPGDISSTATITIEEPPAITVQPTGVSQCSGTGASISVTATGDGLTYLWSENGLPLSDNTIYSGTTTATLNFSSIQGLNGNYYTVQVSGNCGNPVTSSPATIVEDVVNTWNGATSTDWSEASNWSCGIVPIVTTDVVIPNTATNMPLVDIPTAICHSLTIDPGASVMFTGTNNLLEVKADVINNGTFDGTSGTLLLSGTGTQNIPGALYGRLTVAGGSTKVLTGDATVSGILDLSSGFLDIGQYNLALSMPWAQLGGSAGSFIVTNSTGTVVGQGMGAVGGNPDGVMFHVGTSTSSYTPILLENLGDVDTFSVRVMNNVFVDGYGVNPALVPNPVVDRTWMVEEQTPGGSYVNMTPHWNLAEEINAFDQSHVYVAHYTSGDWLGLTTTASAAPPAGTSGGLFTAYADSIQTLSPFAVASIGQFPLSLNLLSFAGKPKSGNVLLNWVTVNEHNLSSFDIERSVDGRKFEKIGFETPVGNGQARENKYAFIDQSINKTGAQKLYYRLKINEQDNTNSYSNVISVALTKLSEAGEVNIYPNPVEGDQAFISMDGTYKKDLSLNVTDVHGRVLNTINLKAGAYDPKRIGIDLKGMAQGVYMIRVTDNENKTISVLKLNRQ